MRNFWAHFDWIWTILNGLMHFQLTYQTAVHTKFASTRAYVALCAFTGVVGRSFIEVLLLRGGISEGEVKSFPSETLKFHRPGWFLGKWWTTLNTRRLCTLVVPCSLGTVLFKQFEHPMTTFPLRDDYDNYQLRKQQ